MSIQRGALPTDSFTIVSNAWLRDPRLSWKAKGLLAYVASHAPGHTLTTEQILAEGTDGKDAVRAGLVELERRGYLRRVALRGRDGKILGTDYELTEPQDGEPGSGKPAPGADQQEQDVSAGHDQSGFPSAGEPAGKKTTTKKTNNTPSASPRGTRLDLNWIPGDDLLKWALAELGQPGWSEASRSFIRKEHAKFVDYWISAPGQRGVKLDWPATWRNWMRRAFERFDAARPVSGPPSSKPFVQQADEYKTRKAQAEKAHGQMVDELIEKGMPFKEALEQANEAKRAFLAQEEVASSSDVAYIDGVILSEDPKEVTGS